MIRMVAVPSNARCIIIMYCIYTEGSKYRIGSRLHRHVLLISHQSTGTLRGSGCEYGEQNMPLLNMSHDVVVISHTQFVHNILCVLRGSRIV